MSKQKNHLPVIGLGPLYVVPIVIITTVSIVLVKIGMIPQSGISITVKHLFHVIGIFFICVGVYLWYSAVVTARINIKIKTNTLVTDGIYAHVRNPIYSAFLFACSGALVLVCNIYVLILPLIFWIYLTIFIKFTEEKWLLNMYGKKFDDYCKKVNRFIPSGFYKEKLIENE